MENKKDWIIEQACHLFLNNTYEGVSVQDICNAIGLTKGALYHHFVNKEDLFKAVIDKYMKTHEGVNPADCSSLHQFVLNKVNTAKKMVTDSVDEKYVPLNYLSLLLDAFRHYPEFKARRGEIFKNELIELKETLTNSIATGEVRNDIDVDATALNFLSVSIGIALSVVRTNSYEQSVIAYEKQLTEMYNLVAVKKLIIE